MPRWTVLAPCALLALVTACSSGPRDCTTMGGSSGVGFDLSALSTPGATTAPAPWQSTACVDDTCQDRTIEVPSETPHVGVDGEGLDGTPVTASLKVVAADGTVLVDAATQVTPTEWDVNGRGCGPFVWVASATVGADGTLY